MVAGTVIHTTHMAVLVRVNPQPTLPGIEPAEPREVWIPRSVCEGGDDLEVGDDDPEVRTWFAEKEGLDW